MSAALLVRLLRTMTLPHWREHRLRTSLTVAGVALGVATVVVVVDIGGSVLASFEHMLTTMAGDMELEVTSPAGSVDERLLAVAAAVPGVEAAGGIIEAFVPLADHADESLYIVGVDFLGSRAWEKQFPRNRIAIDDELVFAAQPTSIALTPAFAVRAGIVPDGELRVITPAGPRTLRVRGTVGDIAPAELFGGAIGLMDLPAAQLLLGREDRLDRIGVRLRRGTSAAEVRARLLSALGPGVDVAAPEMRGQQTEQALLSLRAMLLCDGSFAMIVGALIVYHTVAVSVGQRRRELALLRVLGVGGCVLGTLCLLETAMLAIFGAAIGVGAGRLVAAGTANVIGRLASDVWLRVDVAAAAHSSTGAAAAVGVGIATALVATAIALRATFRTPTIEALQPVGMAPSHPYALALPVIVGLALIASAWLLSLAPHGLGLLQLVAVVSGSHMLAYVGVCILGPALVLGAGLGLRRVAGGSAWLPFRLAAENVPRAPGHGGATVAIIAVATGVAVAIACLVESFETTWLGWVEQHFAADLFVGSGARIRLLAGPPMGEDISRLLQTMPGVAAVEPFRVRPLRIAEHATFLQGISVPDRLAHGGLAMVEGSFAAAAPALRDGTGVLVSDNLAVRLGIHRGDEVRLPTPDGERTFRVEGTYIDFQGSLDLGAVAVASTQLATIWGDRDANLFRIWLQPGASADDARTSALALLGPGYFVLTGKQFVDGTRRVLDGFFLASWMLSVATALVGVIGIVNAQLATVMDRAVEIVTLRTIGLSVRDLTRSVLLECGLLGALGGLAGTALGIMLGAQFVRFGMPLVTGWRIQFVTPLLLPALVLVSSAIVSAVAGYVPARAVARVATGLPSCD